MSEINQIIKEKQDLVDYIGRSVKLKKSGQNFSGLCPFHKEKSPSFFVSPIRQSWHCFGCNRGGDLFSFVMEREGLDFIGALKLLAEETNTPLPKGEGTPQKRIGEVYTVLEEAAKYYQQYLFNDPSAKRAYQYLTEERNVSQPIIKLFQIGFAPDSWDNLGLYLQNKGFSIKELTAAGLIVTKEESTNTRGWYDRFRNRIMFPIHDRIGRTVGFSGRIFGNNNETAKYMNSPETDVFKKSGLLYGFHLAKEEISKQDYVIIVEGQLDVIALHKSGIKNVVAPQGSAFTPEQVKLISRLTKRANLFFDRDSAGIQATLRSLKTLLEHDFEVKITIPSNGKDPDESINLDVETTKRDLAQAKSYYHFLLDFSKDQTSTDDPSRNQKISSFILPFIAVLSNEVQQDTLIQKLAEELRISTKSLQTELLKIKPKNPREKVQIKSYSPNAKPSREESLLNELCAMILQLPPTLESDAIVVDVLKPLAKMQPDTPTKILTHTLVGQMLKKGYIDTKLLNQEASGEATKLADVLILKDLKLVIEDDDLFVHTLEHIVRDIQIIMIKREIKTLVRNGGEGNIQQIRDLTKKLQEIQ